MKEKIEALILVYEKRANFILSVIENQNKGIEKTNNELALFLWREVIKDLKKSSDK